MCVGLAGLLVDHSGMSPDRRPDCVTDVSVCVSGGLCVDHLDGDRCVCYYKIEHGVQCEEDIFSKIFETGRE